MKHSPVSHEHMQNTVGEKLSICEVLRQAYRASADPNVRYKLRLACAMAKGMSKKICDLTGSEEWYQDYWDDNEER